MRRAALLAILALGACGGDSGDGTIYDARPPFDAGHRPDAAPSCSLSLAFDQLAPVAPATISVTATASGISGFLDIARWTVRGPANEAIDVEPLTSDRTRVRFAARDPGSYGVSAQGSVGFTPCLSPQQTINVQASSTPNSVELRLRYVPQPGQGAPPQTDGDIVTVLGGADAELPPRALATATAVTARILGPGGGVPAYLRLDTTSSGFLELFTDGGGRYSGTVLAARTYDVLVVPYDAALAARRFLGASVAAIAQGFTLDEGDALGVVVRDEGGAPVEGARVAAGTAGLPPTIATTGPDGAAALRVRAAAGALALTVVPPLPLARLEIGADADLHVSSGSFVDVRLATVTTARLALTARDAGGVPVAGAQLRLAAALAASGSVSVDGGAPVTRASSVRASAVSGANGVVPPVDLPLGSYEVIVDGAGNPARSTVVLDGDRVASVAAGPVGSLAVEVRASGAPVAGARVVAVAGGLRGAGAGATLSAITGASGNAALAVVPGMPYDVVVDPAPDVALARARARVVGGETAVLVVALPRAVRLGGTIVSSSGPGLPGVRVEATCVDCATPDLAIAEAITGDGGAFTLWVPDPGVR